MNAAAPEPVLIQIPLEPEERRLLLDRVDEIQAKREGALLKVERIPHILLPYQQRWHADLSPLRIADKSRRIGFSWGCLAAESVMEAGHQSGMDQFYMGYNQDMAAEYIGDCAFFARAFQQVLRSDVYKATAIDVAKFTLIIENERRDIVRYSIRLAAGFVIQALSSNPHNWRGRQGHARIDEAAFHQNLKEVIKGAMAFKMWGGRVDVVSTHNGDENEFNQLVRKCVAGQLPGWSHHHVPFDTALAEGFFKRVCLIKGWTYSPEAEAKYRDDTRADYPAAEDAAEELDCVPKRGSGAYFTRAHIERCWDAGIPHLRFGVEKDFFLKPDRMDVTRRWIGDNLEPVLRGIDTRFRTCLGMDFGRDADLSAIWVLQEHEPGRWRTCLVLELRSMPFDCQRAILFHISDGLPLFFQMKLDSRGIGRQLSEEAAQYANLGINKVEMVALSAQWYATHFPLYRNAYEDRAIIVPMSEDLVLDHRRVVLANGQPTMDAGRDKGSDGKPRHGDTAVAGVLAWAATLSDMEPAAGVTIEPGANHTAEDEEQDRPTGMFRRDVSPMFRRRE
ncbi:terminase large subunit domain-containing protein [Niveispirillum cyanobacteriorum]|uniref:Uncharacterized protein n=1 Tax=Niveispirillum cyanobacteriorum TaxID=1612173 RepID=A0A2K9NDP6_9PROT|nr:terminase family protein [Niveispirillum cyanobacteriorum]AUN31248.1 hypothetical protein C0V82_14150 [Niveispirillum cyanobacteriorum]GGE72952.1 hypothetical protein GCM10011317_32730 [Niveispirillum cyanobacteriorum]